MAEQDYSIPPQHLFSSFTIHRTHYPNPQLSIKSPPNNQAYELSILTGTQVLLLVVSETGLVYTFTTTKLQPLVQKPEGKNLIQVCFRFRSFSILSPFLCLIHNI